MGIASNDTALTAFVHAGVEHASRKRFEEAAALEQGLIGLMRVQAPDMERGESHQLNLRHATQELRNEGHSHALPERLRQIVRSISADGRGEGGGGGSLGLRGRDRETLQVTLQREWGALAMTAELRRTAAGLLLEHLLSALPRGSRGTDLLAETTLGKLLASVNSDLLLRSRIRDPAGLTDRALLWLHEQEVIRLNKGLAVFRPAMNVLLKPERRGFAQSDFASLQLHYDEQVRQIHVMAEYAQRGLGSMADALGLAMDYFSLEQDEFLRSWLPDRDRDISRQTTPQSWRSIVESLNNPVQRRIVADDREQTSVLVLAGPGSGKTRVLVHRIAYLVQVLPTGGSPVSQAQMAVAELQRLAGLAPEWDWLSCAVVARQWSYLDPVRSLCEMQGIQVQLANEDFSGVWHLRETRALVKWLRGRSSSLVRSADLEQWLEQQPPGVWNELLREVVAEYRLETGDGETPVGNMIEWLAVWGREARRRQCGLLLLTAHRAKGLEFDHVVVLDGAWGRTGPGEDADAPRRLYYVAMTLARQTLALARLPGPHAIQDALSDVPSVLIRQETVDVQPAASELSRRYRRLSLRDVYLSFAGRRRPDQPVHRAIAALSPGDPLQVRAGENRWELLDRSGTVVGQLAHGFHAPAGTRFASVTVLAIVNWDRERSEPEFRSGLICEAWEVVVPELVFEPDP